MSAPAEPSLERLPSPALRYLLATRPAFLSLTLVGALLGIASAAGGGVRVDPVTASIALLFALVAHAGINVLNDYFDARSGADAANTGRLYPFTGGSRFIQNGVLSERATGAFGYVLLATVIPAGLWLSVRSAPGLVLIGVAGLLLGWSYSAPPLQLASRGLGYGLLTASLLYINQFPDAAADARAGKRTLVVRLGRRRARWGYLLLAGLAGAWTLGCMLGGALPHRAWIAVLPLVLSAAALRNLWRSAEHPSALRGAIVLTILATLAYGSLLSLVFLSRLAR